MKRVASTILFDITSCLFWFLMCRDEFKSELIVMTGCLTMLTSSTTLSQTTGVICEKCMKYMFTTYRGSYFVLTVTF